VLIGRGADVNRAEDWLGETALMFAAAENHPRTIELLVEVGADVNARSRPSSFPDLQYPRTGLVRMVFPQGHWTPLMFAARQGSLGAVRTLAASGADLNLTDPEGATALTLAIINAHYDVAQALLEAGADPDVPDATGRTALYAAVDMQTLAPMYSRPAPKPSGQLDALGIVRLLLERGADPNARLTSPLGPRHHNPGDRSLGEGSTALTRAAQALDLASMELLLAHGADPSLAQQNGRTAAMIAMGARAGDGGDLLAALRLCVERGSDVDAADDRGNTLLHLAAGRGAVDLVEFLLDQGASREARNAEGLTPLDVAMADAGGRQSELIAQLDVLLGGASAQR
jgi:ankyrin repeat protein